MESLTNLFVREERVHMEQLCIHSYEEREGCLITENDGQSAQLFKGFFPFSFAFNPLVGPIGLVSNHPVLVTVWRPHDFRSWIGDSSIHVKKHI